MLVQCEKLFGALIESNVKALVYGFYGSGALNLGDLLFKQAFKKLFPDIQFIFTDYLTRVQLDAADILIFGGGSFLDAPINCEDNLFPIDKKIFYIGVGMETFIHPMHQNLLKQASLIAPRTKTISSNMIGIPDLVYALSVDADIVSKEDIIPNSVLIIPNAELLSNWNDKQWRHSAWNYFKSQMAQFLDELKNSGKKIYFAPMSSMSHKHDLGAAVEIINQMSNRDFTDQISLPSDFRQLTNTISRYETIISQRFHGSILANICKRPCLTISHHDKLNNTTEITISFYGISKTKLHQALSQVKIDKNISSINLNNFGELQKQFYIKLGTECQNISASETAKSI